MHIEDVEDCNNEYGSDVNIADRLSDEKLCNGRVCEEKYDSNSDNAHESDDTEIHRYTFPHEKTYACGKNAHGDKGLLINDTNMSYDEMQFNSMADYEDFLIWGTDYKDQFF